MTRAATLGDARTGLFVLAFASFVGVTTEVLPMGLLPAIAESFGVSESATGRVVTLYALTVAVLAVPLTVATRKLPGKYLILASIVSYVVVNLASALAPTLTILTIARMFGGATHALFFSVVIGYATRLVAPALIGRALALTTAGVSAGLIIGVPFATALGNAVGWRSAFWALVALLGIAAALVIWVLPDVRQESRAATGRATARPAATPPADPGPTAPAPSIPARGRKRDLLAACCVGALTFLGHYTLYTYVSPLLLSSGLPLVWVAPALLLFGALGMLGIWLSAGGLDTHPRRTAFIILGVIGACMIAIGAAIPATVLVLIIGSFWNLASGPMPSLAQTAVVRTRATSPEIAGAWVNVSCNLGIAGGALVGGILFDAFGIAHVAWGGSAFLIIGIVIVFAAKRAFPARAL